MKLGILLVAPMRDNQCLAHLLESHALHCLSNMPAVELCLPVSFHLNYSLYAEPLSSRPQLALKKAIAQTQKHQKGMIFQVHAKRLQPI